MSDFIKNKDRGLINEIIGTVWGYKNFSYFPRNRPARVEKTKYDTASSVDYKFKEKTSYINTPIQQPLHIQISAKGQPVEMYLFPNEPIVELQSSKKIIETDLDGNSGTFKEIYSLGDYAITIRGVAVNENHDEAEDYPEEIVRKFRIINELKHHLEVRGVLFTIFNIKYLTINSFDLKRITGAIGMQPYEFTATSDKVFDLELKKK